MQSEFANFKILFSLLDSTHGVSLTTYESRALEEDSSRILRALSESLIKFRNGDKAISGPK